MIGKSYRGSTPEHGAHGIATTVYHIPVIIGKGHGYGKEETEGKTGWKVAEVFYF